jgi:hypothetical protein
MPWTMPGLCHQPTGPCIDRGHGSRRPPCRMQLADRDHSLDRGLDHGPDRMSRGPSLSWTSAVHRRFELRLSRAVASTTHSLMPPHTPLISNHVAASTTSLTTPYPLAILRFPVGVQSHPYVHLHVHLQTQILSPVTTVLCYVPLHDPTHHIHIPLQ